MEERIHDGLSDFEYKNTHLKSLEQTVKKLNQFDEKNELVSHILHKMVYLKTFESSCKRKSVGCCIFNKNITLFGWNGPSVKDNECSNIVGNCGCSHAEPRAIINVLKNTMIPHSGNIMLCTYSPCTSCANIIIDSGVVSFVIYKTMTEHDTRGAEFLRKAMMINSLKEIEEGNYDNIEKWLQLNHCCK